MAAEISQYSSFTASQDVDTVEICPAYPDLMVIGTYRLVKQEDVSTAGSQARQGCLLLLPVNFRDSESTSDQSSSILCHETFSEAIVELHFHPEHGDVFGAATSAAKVYLYRIRKDEDSQNQDLVTKLELLGWVHVADPDEPENLSHLVTQFTWITGLDKTETASVRESVSLSFIASTSLGTILLIRGMSIQLNNLTRHRGACETGQLSYRSWVLQKHDLEAWTVAAIPIQGITHDLRYLLPSGGDDSRLVASVLRSSAHDQDDDLGTNFDIAKAWSLRRNHDAGIVSILPLHPYNIPHPGVPISGENNSVFIPLRFLTGSYDEHIRLFQLSSIPEAAPPKQLAERRLGGGVWRIKLMDEYITENPRKASDPQNARLYNHILLISCMHDGVKIVRMTTTCPKGASQQVSDVEQVEFIVEAELRAGHASMVYSCDFRRDSAVSTATDDGGTFAKKGQQYTIVSTSFYDRQICTWKWTDEKYPL